MTYTENLELIRTRGGHTDAEWHALKREFRFHCVRCLQRFRSWELTRDHIAPVSLGGTDTIANIQPMCARCNGKKGDKVKDYRAAARRFLMRTRSKKLTGVDE